MLPLLEVGRAARPEVSAREQGGRREGWRGDVLGHQCAQDGFQCTPGEPGFYLVIAFDFQKCPGVGSAYNGSPHYGKTFGFFLGAAGSH